MKKNNYNLECISQNEYEYSIYIRFFKPFQNHHIDYAIQIYSIHTIKTYAYILSNQKITLTLT